jgi:AraC-like DNA-binding protein
MTHFRIINHWESLPLPLGIGCETQASPRYWLRGAGRVAVDYCAFQCTLSGQGVFIDANGSHEVGPGQGFLFNTHDQEWEYGYPAGATEPWHFLYIEFTGGNALKVERELIRRHGPVFTLDGDEIPAMLQDWRQDGWGTQEISAAAGALIVSRLLSALAAVAEKEAVAPLPPSLAARVRRQVGKHLDSLVTVSGLAAELGVSREHLSRCFQKETGISLYQYILSEKLEVARHQLRSTSLSSKEIAQRLGFNSRAQFARIFRQKLGQTPGGFRRGDPIEADRSR